MIDRKFFYSMMFSTVAFLAIQYYFSSSSVDAQQAVVAGQSFKAPVNTEIRPLFKEIDFVDDEKMDSESFVTMETDRLLVQFSNHGGAPVLVALKKHRDKEGNPLKIFDYVAQNEREKRSFAVVMGDDAAAPYNYELVEKTDRSVTYVGQTKTWKISKKYEIADDKYTMNLSLSVEPRHAKVEAVIPRLFVTVPCMEGLVDNTVNGFVQKTDTASFEKMTAAQEAEWFWVAPHCIGGEDRYAAEALIADEQKFVKRAYFKKTSQHHLQVIFESGLVSQKETWNLNFYVGPKTVESLSTAGIHLEGLLSFGWLSMICKWLLLLLQWLYQYFRNYGVAIIILTALIKIPFIPFMIYAKRKMEEMQRYQPSIEHIRTKYRADVQKQHEEMMRFYKEHNLSPSTQLLGCLPLFLQLPVFFSLYRVLSNYIELYQAPFFGWITDLSVKDPYYVLPILMGVAMFIQQVYTPTKDSRQRFIMLFMPFMVTAIFMNFPAGMVLYWAFNNIFTMMEDQLRRTFFA
jgi:YidC/Oxa1 family membrane protein insertase